LLNSNEKGGLELFPPEIGIDILSEIFVVVFDLSQRENRKEPDSVSDVNRRLWVWNCKGTFVRLNVLLTSL